MIYSKNTFNFFKKKSKLTPGHTLLRLGLTFLRPGLTPEILGLTPEILGLTPYGSAFFICAPERFWYAPPRDSP